MGAQNARSESRFGRRRLRNRSARRERSPRLRTEHNAAGTPCAHRRYRFVVQLSDDYEARFAAGDTPWEDEVVSPVVTELVAKYGSQGVAVLDVGCGLGLNARWLAQAGFDVTACDVSSTAIERAAAIPGSDAISRWENCDFVTDFARLGTFDVVLDRGVSHTFADTNGRRSFVVPVASSLHDHGI